MSMRPVKLASSGSSFAISDSVSLIVVPTLNRLSSNSGVSRMTARAHSERTIVVSDVSSSTAKHSVSELLPAE